MTLHQRGKTLLPGLLLLICSVGLAQRPEELLQRWSETSPIEKVYLQFDRENYPAGETAWFKAYLYSDYLPDTISTTLYVELLNDSSVILIRKILPVFLGNTFGQFELPDSMKTGYYFIRAYSPAMFNMAIGPAGPDPGFIGQQHIFVFGRKNKKDAAVLKKQKALRFEFFPEGGNLITGLANTVAFKATDENGLPVPVSGDIKNEKDEVIAAFHTYHDGMGMFDLAPLPHAKYHAVLRDDTTEYRYYLPGQTEQGIVFKIISTEKRKYFELLQPINNPVFNAGYMIGQMQHHVVFRQDFPPGRESITGAIDVSRLNSGILQVTVFNKDNIPLAERLTFVDNGEYIQRAELLADTINFSAKAKNKFHVSLRDTAFGFFSVSVTDPGYNFNSARQQNIISTLLLTSDLRGYIHNPAFYFSDHSDSARNALDLVMMINGWRRFRWSSLLSNNLQPVYTSPGYIAINGHIKIRNTKKPFADKPFLLFVVSPDSSRIIRMSSTDHLGNFRIDSFLFFDRSSLLFKDIRGKKSDRLQVKLSGDSLTKRFQFPGGDKQNHYRNVFPGESREKKPGYDDDAILNAEGLILEGVTVKSRKKSSLQELEEKYASGLFGGMSAHTIDLVHTTDIINSYENIIDYLSYKVPGLNVTRDGLDYYIYYRQIASASSMGLIPMTLYLDEIETDASFVSSIPASQVALVKVYSSFVGAVGNGAGGALAIYTKKGTDINQLPSIADMVSYRGYSVIKEFYAPDYAVDTAALKKQDHRITLLWAPQIIASSIDGNFPVTFYNNDRATQFKIVVEGITVDGKLLMIEKTFGQK